MTQQEIEELADELIAEIASTWPDSHPVRAVQENGDYFFVFVIAYKDSDSIIRFNPKGAAIKIIKAVAEQVEDQLTDTILTYSIRDTSKRRLFWLLSTAGEHFVDSFSQMPIIAAVAVSNQVLEPLTRDSKMQNEVIEILIKGFGEKLRRRLISKRARRPRAFSDFEAHVAIMRLGGHPSQHQLAKALKTTTKTVLSWVRDKGFDSLADFLDAFHSMNGDGEKQ